MQIQETALDNNTKIKACQETFGEEVEDEGEYSCNTRAKEELELVELKRKGKIESKYFQPNMQLKDESENLSEAAQQTEEK